MEDNDKYLIKLKSRVSLENNPNITPIKIGGRTVGYTHVKHTGYLTGDLLEHLNKVVGTIDRKKVGVIYIANLSQQTIPGWALDINLNPVILDPILEQFLRENSIYTRFMKNVYKQMDIGLMGEVELDNFLTAFIWSKTPEGEKYWNKWDTELYTYRSSKEWQY